MDASYIQEQTKLIKMKAKQLKEQMKVFKKAQRKQSREQIRNVCEQLQIHQPQFIQKQNNVQQVQFQDNSYMRFEDERFDSPKKLFQLQDWDQIRPRNQVLQPQHPIQYIQPPISQQQSQCPQMEQQKPKNCIKLLYLQFNHTVPFQQQIQNIEQKQQLKLIEKPQNLQIQEEDLQEEKCKYCQTFIIKLFTEDHLQECISYIEHQFKSIETLHMVHECSVCCLDVELNDPKKILSCGHMFHIYCLEEWLQIKKECPYCRAPVQ